MFIVLFSASRADERQILLDLKASLSKSSTNVFTSWTESNSVCKFTGVVCDSDGLVKEINLPLQGLIGVLPFASICGLQSLERIDFGNNSLHGSVSDDLKNCRNLKVLDLGVNYFSCQVPDLSSLVNLTFLNLNSSGFSGKFPWKSLQNLKNLRYLSLGDNPFDSTLFPEEILNLENLYWVYLSNCSIRGQIPESIGKLINLENLELSDNQLSGEIPSGIGSLTKLFQLELYNNSLTGKLPAGFSNLTGLVNFDASMNYLEGDLLVLRFLKNISSLQLFVNQFSGEIPEEFGEFRNLTRLSLYTNKLTGSVPQKIGSWADFIWIDVSENFLTGPIPPDMCKNGKMTELLILQNQFTGTIPETYANCKSLNRLRVNNNSLSGVVPPGIWGLPNLSIIDLTSNRFEGRVTEEIGNAKSLAQLFLADNQFSGELPSMISQASSLVSIELSSNQFSGQIPSSISRLKKLNSIELDENKFSGSIPDSLGSCVSLSSINFAQNSLSGEIPDSLGSLPSLNALNISTNKISGEIPVYFSYLKLSLLDLSNNQLVGPIPEALNIPAFREGLTGNPGLCIVDKDNPQSCSMDSRKARRHLPKILWSFVAVTIALLLTLTFYLCKKSKHDNSENPLKMKQNSWRMKSFRVLSFTEREITDAIKPENLIGRGGSGNVYKVVLDNGKKLAVKHIWHSKSGNQKNYQSTSSMITSRTFRSAEFEAEIATLSAVRHVNVVKLYCSITSEDSNLLVYEYLPNGSLWDKLHTNQKIKMGWDVRYTIAVGAAKGLEYLHHGCNRPVVHRDVKSSNILLDEDLKPRIADFGLSKIIQVGDGGDWTHVIAGTLGYIAPGKILLQVYQ